jgi:5-methylcytosine-specific restriction enzyme A
MTGKLGVPCKDPMCHEIVDEDQRYCEKHKREYNKARDKERGHRHNVRGESKSNKAFYDSAVWRRFRLAKLMRNGLCEKCLTAVYIKRNKTNGVVDHIIPLNQGGAALSMENVMTLCHPCHNRKRAEEARKYGRAKDSEKSD